MVDGLCDIDKEQLATHAVIVRHGDREMELELCEYHYNQLRRHQSLSASFDEDLLTAGMPAGSPDENFAGFASQLGYSRPRPGRKEASGIGDIVTEQSKQLIQEAAQTAVAFGRREVDTEHLLYALAGSKPVQKILGSFELDTQDIRASIDDRALKTERPASPDEPIELTVPQHMKQVLDTALQTTNELGHTRIGPEHLLIGVAQVPNSTGGQVLRQHGLTPHAIRQTISNGSKD